MIRELFSSKKEVLTTDFKALYEKEGSLLKESFYFLGNNGKAVLLIHGWTDVSYEMRRLGKYLNENGYTVFGPMLSGHGTKPEDLEKVKWEDWMKDVNEAFDRLSKNHEKIYAVGTSMGSNLAVMLAKNRPNVSGLVLMAMPYKVRLEKISAFLASIIKHFKKYGRKFYPPTFGASTTVTRLISYQTYPIQNALELYKLIKISRKELPKVTQPCLMMQSNSDHVVTRDSMEKMFEKINSKIKEKKYIHRAYHTFISDIDNENVLEDILGFIEAN